MERQLLANRHWRLRAGVMIVTQLQPSIEGTMQSGPFLRSRIQNLRKLGIREDEAVTHGVSSKGPWVMSSSQAVHEALSLTGPATQAQSENRLAGQGLVSLFTIWQKFTARNLTVRCGPARRVVCEGPRSNPGPYPDSCSPLSCGRDGSMNPDGGVHRGFEGNMYFIVRFRRSDPKRCTKKATSIAPMKTIASRPIITAGIS